MSNSPGQNPESGFFDELTLGALDKMFFDDWLKDVDPEVLDDIARKKNKNASDYIAVNGEIDLAMLKKDLTLTDRFSLMFSNFAGDFVSDLLEETLPDLSDRINVKSFADTVESLDFDEGPVYLADENNLIASSGSPLDQVSALWQMIKDSSVDVDEMSVSLSLIIKDARSIVGAGVGGGEGKASPFNVKVMGQVCEKLGLEFNIVTPKSSLKKPDDNEVQLVLAPSLLPMKTGSSTEVDLAALEWYKDLYEDDAGGVWYSASPVLAGVYVLGGMSIADALDEVGSVGDEALSVQLTQLEKQLNPVPVAEVSHVDSEASAASESSDD